MSTVLWSFLAWTGWIPALIFTCWLAGVILMAVRGAARWCRKPGRSDEKGTGA